MKLAWISSSFWGKEDQRRTKKSYETFTTRSSEGYTGKLLVCSAGLFGIDRVIIQTKCN